MSIIELTNKNVLDILKKIDSCIATRNERMMEIPGIGSVLCDTILAEVGDITKNNVAYDPLKAGGVK